MNLWNKKGLEPPPIATYKTHSYTEIRQLRSYLKKALDFFNNQKILEKEAALLSRCIYRMKMKFRSDKGLKSMEKLNRALLQFNYIKLHDILDDFYSLLPTDKNEDLYLPTRNMLDFILIRLQSTAFLMCRAIEVAQIAASCMGSRICIGQFWKVALIMLGVISRIWIICKNILKRTCEFYKNMLPIRKELKNISIDWLPSDYTFPNNLEEILNVDLLSDDAEPDLGLFKSIVPIIDVIENSNVEECGDYVPVTDQNDEGINTVDDRQLNNEINKCGKINVFELLTNDEDLGEVICESTKQVRNIIDISSDSEDDVNIVNEKLNNLKAKQNTVNNDDNNKKRKKKKLIESNRRKSKVKKCINNSKIKVENVTLEIAKIIGIEGKERKNVEIERIHKRNNSEQSTKRKDKKQFVSSKDGVIDNINTLKELKIFIKKESKHKENPQSKGVLGNMDKLQWNMLRKHIKKFFKKAHNNLITDTQCLIEVKRILKATLDN